MAVSDMELYVVSQVMSGSGDLQVMRVIRQLRVRVGHAEVTYGSQLATHMALGFLFLGSGRCVARCAGTPQTKARHSYKSLHLQQTKPPCNSHNFL